MRDVSVDPHQERLIRIFTALCAIVPAGVALIVLAGWQTGQIEWTRVLPGSLRVLPNSALMVFLGAASLALLLAFDRGPWRALSGFLASLGAAIAVLILIEHAGADLPGLDTLLAAKRLVVLGMEHPGRPSPHTALVAALATLSLAVRTAAVHGGGAPPAVPEGRRLFPVLRAVAGQLWAPEKCERAADILAGLALVAALLALQGGAFGVRALQGTHGVRMSPPTAAGLALVAGGSILACKEHGMGAWLASSRPSGTVLRRLLPVALLVPLLVSWFVLQGHEHGYFGNNVGHLLISTVMIAVMSALVGWIAVSLDRSAIRQEAYQARLMASEARFRSLFEAAPDGMLVVNQGGIIRSVNSRVEEIFKYSRNQLLGQEVEILVPEELRERHRLQRATYAAHPETRPVGVGLRLQGLCSDGTRIDVEIALSPLSDDGSTEILAVIRNVTARRRFEAEQAALELEAGRLRELAALKEHVLSSLSHEVKTPLSLILGYAELLEEDHPQDFRIEGILDGCKRLTAHINTLLDYSALAAGSLPLYRTEVIVPEIVRSAITGWSPAIRTSGVRFEANISPDVPPVQGDARRIAEIFDILLDNALKFTPSGGLVRVEVFTCADRACFEVSDTGPGIDPALLARIWEPFGKAEVGAGWRGGLGLGLALARKLAEAHGGTLAVRSETGMGCTFTVQLPAANKVE